MEFFRLARYVLCHRTAAIAYKERRADADDERTTKQVTNTAAVATGPTGARALARPRRRSQEHRFAAADADGGRPEPNNAAPAFRPPTATGRRHRFARRRAVVTTVVVRRRRTHILVRTVAPSSPSACLSLARGLIATPYYNNIITRTMSPVRR